MEKDYFFFQYTTEKNPKKDQIFPNLWTDARQSQANFIYNFLEHEAQITTMI